MGFLIKKKKVNFANSWHEVPFKIALVILQEKKSPLEVMALIADIPLKELRNMEDVVVDLYQAYTFLSTLPSANAFPARS